MKLIFDIVPRRRSRVQGALTKPIFRDAACDHRRVHLGGNTTFICRTEDEKVAKSSNHRRHSRNAPRWFRPRPLRRGD
jgi:uncharacterized protein YaaQ